jgi:hypothetical protein
MAAHVLHIGTDDCHRVAVLRSVGYKVDECASLQQLATALDGARDADALILAESDDIAPEQAIQLARDRCEAPLIFFRRTGQGASEDEFDLVIPPLTSPERWVKEVGGFLERSRMLRDQTQVISEQSRLLQKETRILRQDSERERERSVRERKRNSDADATDPWKFPGAC